MKPVKYSNVFELKLIRDQIALDAVTFPISAAVLAWCQTVSDNEVIYQRFKTVRDLILQQHNRLKNFAAEFVREIKICAQYSSEAHQDRAWQDLNVLIINAEKRQKRVKRGIKSMKRRWSDETMNQLMLEIRNHHVADETVKLIKEYSINFEKIIKRLQLTVLRRKEKINRDIRAIIVYILNDFKRAHSKTYADFFASTQANLRAADLMIRNIRLMENSQANVFFDEDFVEDSSVTASRVDIIEIDISTSSTRAVVFGFSISKIVSITSRKTSRSEKINQFSKSSIFSSAVSSISF